MKITYHAVGEAMFQFDAANIKEALQELSFLQSLPSECPKCGKALRFFYRNPQDNTYYGLICAGAPAHETNFGQYKKGDGLYYKNDWQNAFAGSHSESSAEEIARFDTADAEPRAEHERLDKLIAEEWAKGKRAVSYAESVQRRYGTAPAQLRIKEKREILEKLQNAPAAAAPAAR